MEILAKLPEEEIPASICRWLVADEDSLGYGAFYGEGYLYLAVKLGRRPTGGYAVLLGDVQLNIQTTVGVQKKAPGPCDMVAQVITYPRTAVRIECSEQPETVIFTEGNTVIAKVAVLNLDKGTGGD